MNRNKKLKVKTKDQEIKDLLTDLQKDFKLKAILNLKMTIMIGNLKNILDF